MSENADRLDRIERTVAKLGKGLRNELEVRRVERAEERKMYRSLARRHAKRRRGVEEQRRVLMQMLDALIRERKKNGSQ